MEFESRMGGEIYYTFKFKNLGNNWCRRYAFKKNNTYPYIIQNRFLQKRLFIFEMLLLNSI